MREAMSRPSLSVPKGWSSDGGCRLSSATVVVSIAMGSPSQYGAQRSAVTAIKTHYDYPYQSGYGQLVLAQTPDGVGPQRAALSRERLQVADGDVGRAAVRRGDRRGDGLVRISGHVQS